MEYFNNFHNLLAGFNNFVYICIHESNQQTDTTDYCSKQLEKKSGEIRQRPNNID